MLKFIIGGIISMQNLNYKLLQPLSSNNRKNKEEKAKDSNECK